MLFSYLTVNYETSSFNVSRCIFEDGAQENIIPIPSADAGGETTHAHRNPISITVGTVVLVLLLSGFSVFAFLKYRRRQHKLNIRSASPSDLDSSTSRFLTIQRTPKEICENSLSALHNGHKELGDTALAELAQLSRSTVAQWRTINNNHAPTVASSTTFSNFNLPSPAMTIPQTHPGFAREQDRCCQSCRTPTSPASASSRTRRSILNRPLPSIPKEVTRNTYMIDMAMRYEPRSGRSPKTVAPIDEECIRTGTPF